MKTVDKQRWSTETRRPGRGGSPWRRRLRFLVLVLLTALVLHGIGYGLGVYLYSGDSGEGSEEPEELVEAPVVEQPPEEPIIAAVEEPPVPVATPEDPTLYLTVPRLGVQGHTVRNDRSEEALGLGAIKLPQSGFPWQEGANTYIACHRLGFPGTESYNQCLNLPSMQQGDEVVLADSEGTLYEYRVSEVFAVGPNDSYVTEPLDGRDVVTLQTCTETPNDWMTLGPRLISSGPESGRLIVRADRIG